MSKLLNVLLLTTLVSGCARLPTDSAPSSDIDHSALTGIWAMRPLNNGIANVVEFRPDGKAILYPFNCETPDEKEEPEASRYTLNVRNKTLRLVSPGYDNTLRVVELKPRTMIMEQPFGEGESDKLTFSYIKLGKVVPLCYLYTQVKKSDKTAYTESNFVPAPTIPEHPDLAKYIGKWQENGATQLEILRGKDGKAYLYQDSENWKQLFNNVRWVKNELHFQNYAYSEKPELFDHPYHKSLIPTVIRLLPNGKLHVTLQFPGEKSELELTRE